MRDTYREDIAPIIENNPFKAEQVDADMEGFENDMKNVLKVRGFSKRSIFYIKPIRGN